MSSQAIACNACQFDLAITLNLLAAFVLWYARNSRWQRKKAKRKMAHPKLPMQRQLNLQHEGKYFDLRAIFDRLNERHFRGTSYAVIK